MNKHENKSFVNTTQVESFLNCIKDTKCTQCLDLSCSVTSLCVFNHAIKLCTLKSDKIYFIHCEIHTVL